MEIEQFKCILFFLNWIICLCFQYSKASPAFCLTENNLVQASLLTLLSWILLLGHERKEQTWSSFLWAWRCVFPVILFNNYAIGVWVPICYSQVASQAVYSLHKTSTREVYFSQNNRKFTDIQTVPIFIFFSILMCLIIFAISCLFSCF